VHGLLSVLNLAWPRGSFGNYRNGRTLDQTASICSTQVHSRILRPSGRFLNPDCSSQSNQASRERFFHSRHPRPPLPRVAVAEPEERSTPSVLYRPLAGEGIGLKSGGPQKPLASNDTTIVVVVEHALSVYIRRICATNRPQTSSLILGCGGTRE
jgi:hypothetical protein